MRGWQLLCLYTMEVECRPAPPPAHCGLSSCGARRIAAPNMTVPYGDEISRIAWCRRIATVSSTLDAREVVTPSFHSSAVPHTHALAC